MLAGCVPWPGEDARLFVERGYWRELPLGALLWQWADRWPDREALGDGEVRVSYRDLAERADRMAAGLAAVGLKAGDRVVVQLPNGLDFVDLTLACFRLGALPVMALPPHRAHEITYLARHSDAVAYAGPDVHRGFDHQALAYEVQRDAPGLRHVLVAGRDVRPGSVDLRALAAQHSGSDAAALRARLDAAAPSPYEPALFLLSGGTTGLPKLIPRTHNDYEYNARVSAELCGFDAGTVYLVALPIGHNFPLACPGVLGTLAAGGRVVLAPSPDPDTVFPLIARERVTHTAVVPAVAQRWLDAVQAGTAQDLSSLRVLQVGGARIAPEVARRVLPILGATLQQVFGMAEGLLNYTRLDDPDEVVIGTQGRPASPADEVRVVGADDVPVPDGELGDLITRGPYTIRGYYLAPEHNERSFTKDGFYRTGDVVRRHPSGNLVVEGRVKDLVNRGGEKISAEEIENLVLAHPAVSRVAAVAMPDRDLGERLCVYVVPRPGATLALQELREAMTAAGVARFKLPDRLELADALPLTNVGKVDKQALRLDVAARLQEPPTAPGGAP